MVACYSVAMAFRSFAVLEQIEGRAAGSLASPVVEVVVHQDPLVLKLKLRIEIQLELMLSYELAPCYSFVQEYQRLASMVFPMRMITA